MATSLQKQLNDLAAKVKALEARPTGGTAPPLNEFATTLLSCTNFLEAWVVLGLFVFKGEEVGDLPQWNGTTWEPRAPAEVMATVPDSASWPNT